MGKGLNSIYQLCALLGTLAFPGAAVAADGDYLSPELRARVEQLKAEVAAAPSDASNREVRARVLWDWANAYALKGGVLPVNLTQAITIIFAYADALGPRRAGIDEFIFEMSLLDEQPDAIGTLQADVGPFEAGAWVTVTQTYRVGARQIQTGGGFLVARHFMPNYGLWQTSDPRADNFLSISSTNPRVSFVTASAPIAGMHGDFRGIGEGLVFRLASGTLEPGDQVTITYGDTSQGSRGFLMADFSSDRMPLPLYLAFNEDEPFLTLPIQAIEVIGGALAGVHAFAPSVVATGEPFTLAVRAQDRFYNRSGDGHRGWRISLNGTPFKDLPAGPDPISLVDGVRLNEPGVYRFAIESPDGRIRGESNPVLVEVDPVRRIYWGDTHGHSGFAEGIGSADRFMTWARDDARLDFVTHSEHDLWMDDYEWEVLRNNVRSYTKEGSFIAYLGYEWTVRNIQGGHHNVLYRTPEGRERISGQFYPTLSALYAGLRATSETRDVVVIPHAHQAGDYRQNDPQLEPLIEIMSQHGNFEWFGRMYLNHGHQVGFTAASDNHLSQPGFSAPINSSLAQRGGLGAVLAAEKSTDAIFDGMKSLNAYATTGDRIILDFSVNGTAMGQRAPFANARSIRGRVIGTAPIDSITLIKNDAEVWRYDYLTEDGDRTGAGESLLLSFVSDSEPVQTGDNPRGWRHWRGTLRVENARILAAEGRDFHNLAFQTLTVDPESPDLIHFTTLTRGDSSSIALELADVKRSTALHLNLEPARETGGAPPIYRKPQLIPAAALTLYLRDMDNGRLRQSLAQDDYEDQIILRRVISEGPRDVQFAFDDTDDSQGDYYFVRINQANDAVAWSSPVWVGGHPKR
ncbi:MAG: DUF3604 domain-containing protein [Pseudomonadales bacterium]